MEQHKVLLIIVSVCLFFAAVLGVGLWLFYPRSGTSPAGTPVAGTQTSANTKEGKTGFDPIEYLRQGEQQQPPALEQPQQKKSTGDVIIVYGSGQKGNEAAGATPGSSGAQTQPGTQQSPGQGGAAVSSAPPAGNSTASPGQAPSAGAAQRAPAVASTPTRRTVPGLGSGERAESAAQTRSRAVTQVRTAARREQAKAAAKAPSREFWIQLVASTHRDTIESALGTLRQYSVSGHITTVSVGDKDFYRLRVGPYASKQEAEKFQSWIRDIKDFKDAYVSEVYNN